MFVDEQLGFHVGVYYNAVCRVVNKPNIEWFHLMSSNSENQLVDSEALAEAG